MNHRFTQLTTASIGLALLGLAAGAAASSRLQAAEPAAAAAAKK